MSPEDTFSSTPPPYEYVKVSVVLDGASPKAFVFKKLLGSKASPNLLGLPGKLEPTVSGFGMSSSSGVSETPAPNLINVSSFWLIKVVNLLDVFFSFSKYGDTFLSTTKLGELSTLFSISSKIVSLAKESTSYQLLPSLSTQEIISIMSFCGNLICLYFSALANVKLLVVTVPLWALTLFFKRYLVTAPLSVSNISTSLGSYELENLKLTSSSVLKVVPLLPAVICVPDFTVKAYL